MLFHCLGERAEDYPLVSQCFPESSSNRNRIEYGIHRDACKSSPFIERNPELFECGFELRVYLLGAVAALLGRRIIDYILEINGKGISRKKELISEIEKCGGEEVELLVNRKGEEIPISLEPVFTQDEEYKLGIWVRDNTQGIGTLTYIDQEGKFGALGHGISDTDTGELLDVSGGELYQAQIISIIRGKQGTPGELSGYIEYEEDKKIGTIEKNTDIGIFGKLFSGMEPLGEKVKIGYKQEVKEGKAQILMELEGEPEYYDIEITEIYGSQQDPNKSFQILVTDPALLAKTGGIVQGMSGSPILQDGKLIGAVTHVFVQDAAKGYGIFIENMLG